MHGMTPFRRNNLSKREDFFPPFFKNMFDDDFLSAMSYMNGNFRVDLKETDNQFQVEADLPGIKKEDINIDFEDNYLIISAKRDEELEDQKENYVRRERHYGEFKRSFYISNVDENKIDATFNDGVLKITLPKIANSEEKKKKIDIK